MLGEEIALNDTHSELEIRKVCLESESSKPLLKLIAFLVVSSVADENEWELWGAPFLRLLSNGIVSRDQITDIVDDLSTVFAFKGEGKCFISDYSSENDFIFVKTVDEYLNAEASAVALSEADVKVFLERLVHRIITEGEYDSRARSVTKKVFAMLSVPNRILQSIEQREMSLNYNLSSASAGSRSSRVVATDPSPNSPSTFLTACREGERESMLRHNFPVVSLSRLFQIAAAATVGGGLMCLASSVNFAVVTSTVTALLSSSATASELLAKSALLFDTVTMTATGTLSVSVLTAGIASYKMMKRTAPLKEFYLEPLHIPTCAVSSYDRIEDATSVHEQQEGDVKREESSISDVNVVLDVLSAGESLTNAIRANLSSITEEAVASEVKSIAENKVVNTLMGGAVSFQSMLPQSTESNIAARQIAHDVVGSVFPPDHHASLSQGETDLSIDGLSSSMLVLDGNSGGKGLPVFILVSGYCERGLDFRYIWGAEGLSQDEESFSSLPQTSIGHAYTHSWWRKLVPQGEEYLLHWDRSILDNLADSYRNFLMHKGMSLAIDEMLKISTISKLVHVASLPVNVLERAAELDNPWAVAIDHSQQAGEALARLLIETHYSTFEEASPPAASGKAEAYSVRFHPNQGCDELSEGFVDLVDQASDEEEECGLVVVRKGRPVTLIGYGMGARVIFDCLEALAARNTQAFAEYERQKREKKVSEKWKESGHADIGSIDNSASEKESKALPNRSICSLPGSGIVENVVLIGAPVGTRQSSWLAVRSVVAGRLVNCYSRRDWFLALMYRSKTWDFSVAGLQPIVLQSNQHRSPHHPEDGEHSATAHASTKRDSSVSLQLKEKEKFNEEGNNVKESRGESREVETYTIEGESKESEDRKTVERMLRMKRQLSRDSQSAWKREVENVDVTDIVHLHGDYPKALFEILSRVGLEEYT